MNFYVLELITDILRVFMLWKSLKLTGYIYLDPIFVELCGVMSSFFALLKAVKRKSFENRKEKSKEVKAESPKRVIFHEEEKKSKDLFNLNQMEMSVDDSDVGEDAEESPYQGYPINKVGRFKSSLSSTHDFSQSNKSNGKLKQVKSTANVHLHGILNGLRNYQE